MPVPIAIITSPSVESEAPNSTFQERLLANGKLTDVPPQKYNPFSTYIWGKPVAGADKPSNWDADLHPNSQSASFGQVLFLC